MRQLGISPQDHPDHGAVYRRMVRRRGGGRLMLAAMAGLPPFSTANEAAPDLADLLAHDAPEITLDMAADLARDLYGVSGDIRALSAEKDTNFHIRLHGGEEAL